MTLDQGIESGLWFTKSTRSNWTSSPPPIIVIFIIIMVFSSLNDWGVSEINIDPYRYIWSLHPSSMKKTILALFILLAIWRNAQAQVNFGEKMAIEETVAKWNSALHLTTIDQLNNLYAPTVLSNGIHIRREACIQEKSNLLNQFAGLHQEIITPIQITVYQSGTIRCSFIKRVRFKQTVEEYKGYLLLQKSGDHYQITGEGGLESEQSLKAGVKLGEEISGTPTSDSYWVIFCAASLLLMVIVIWKMGKSSAVAPSFTYPRKNMHATLLELNKKIIRKRVDRKIPVMTHPISTMHTPQTATLNEEHKGRAFEEFILDKFPKDRFKLVEWRSDKIFNGRFPEASKWPDLQLELKLRSEKYPFAVECKWRNDFWKGIIEWARDAQISAYQEFQVSKEMPVFIALGVGGTPAEPRDLFIIPLSHLYKSILTEDWLKKYKRESREHFFLNLDPILLK
jgi:hypothetical protein